MDKLADNDSFAKLNQKISTRIYHRFLQGKVINKLSYQLQKSAFVEDKDYVYLFRYQSQFELLYALIGKTLVYHAKGEFYYIDNNADTDLEEADEHALKTQSILLVIARHFEMSGRGINQLSDEHTGLHLQDTLELDKHDEYKAICKALKFKNWLKATEYLVNRGFAFETSPESFVLSSAGTAFCHALLDAYDKR